MKKFIKVICLLLCMTMTTALFVACAKSDDESQGSTNSGGSQIKLSDYFEEEVANGFTNESQKMFTTLTKLTDNIAWNSDNIDSGILLKVKKDFRLLGVSFDIKALQDFGESNKLIIYFRYNNDSYNIFKLLNEDLYKQQFQLNYDEIKNFSYDFTKKYISKGYLIEKGNTFLIGFTQEIATIDNIKFTINPA